MVGGYSFGEDSLEKSFFFRSEVVPQGNGFFEWGPRGGRRGAKGGRNSSHGGRTPVRIPASLGSSGVVFPPNLAPMGDSGRGRMGPTLTFSMSMELPTCDSCPSDEVASCKMNVSKRCGLLNPPLTRDFQAVILGKSLNVASLNNVEIVILSIGRDPCEKVPLESFLVGVKKGNLAKVAANPLPREGNEAIFMEGGYSFGEDSMEMSSFFRDEVLPQDRDSFGRGLRGGRRGSRGGGNFPAKVPATFCSSGDHFPSNLAAMGGRGKAKVVVDKALDSRRKMCFMGSILNYANYETKAKDNSVEKVENASLGTTLVDKALVSRASCLDASHHGQHSSGCDRVQVDQAKVANCGLHVTQNRVSGVTHGGTCVSGGMGPMLEDNGADLVQQEGAYINGGLGPTLDASIGELPTSALHPFCSLANSSIECLNGGKGPMWEDNGMSPSKRNIPSLNSNFQAHVTLEDKSALVMRHDKSAHVEEQDKRGKVEGATMIHVTSIEANSKTRAGLAFTTKEDGLLQQSNGGMGPTFYISSGPKESINSDGNLMENHVNAIRNVSAEFAFNSNASGAGFVQQSNGGMGPTFCPSLEVSSSKKNISSGPNESNNSGGNLMENHVNAIRNVSAEFAFNANASGAGFVQQSNGGMGPTFCPSLEVSSSKNNIPSGPKESKNSDGKVKLVEDKVLDSRRKMRHEGSNSNFGSHVTLEDNSDFWCTCDTRRQF